MQILLTIAYDGTDYAGWQRQNNAVAVQQVLEETLSGVLQREIRLRAASRTDAGVHALGQRAAFNGGGLRIPLEKLPEVINNKLPNDISVTGCQSVPEDFNPRHAAHKTYRYQILNYPYPDPMLTRYAAFVPQSLDINAMKKAAPCFMGRHDFLAFSASGGNGTDLNHNTVREIYNCQVTRDGGLITLTVTGNGFLYNMVRIIAGTVLYAGLKKIKPGDIPGIIRSRERGLAGKTMGPEGLTLMEVIYT